MRSKNTVQDPNFMESTFSMKQNRAENFIVGLANLVLTTFA